jgi:hypothetical protein
VKPGVDGRLEVILLSTEQGVSSLSRSVITLPKNPFLNTTAAREMQNILFDINIEFLVKQLNLWRYEGMRGAPIIILVSFLRSIETIKRQRQAQ